MTGNDFEIEVYDQEWIEWHTNTEGLEPGSCAIIKYRGKEKDGAIGIGNLININTPAKADNTATLAIKEVVHFSFI